MSKLSGLKILSSSTLKLLACLFMLIDHIGVMLCPNVYLMRVIGRLAYPIFAYFIAVGCKYTKNKLKRFLSVFVLGVLCEAVYMLVGAPYYGNILLTFSFSIALIYLLYAVKASLKHSRQRFVLMLSAFAVSVAATYLYCTYIGLDYGFFGVMSPVMCALVDEDIVINKYRIDGKLCSLALFAVGLYLTTLNTNALSCQIWCLCAVLLLLLYNGERGKYSLKYAFYIFYPLHLVALQVIAMYLM